MKDPKYLSLLISICFNSLFLHAQKDTLVAKDVVYAEIGSRQLLLDIYMPDKIKNPYLVVWIHGGAWSSGSKDNPPKGLLKEGFALASIDYRLSGEAIFPSPIHDIKAAIRFLRGNAKKYGYRSDKIIIWGASSGGHYAALVGATNNDLYYEGTLGNYTNESSSVQAVLDFYGPTDFLTILKQSTPHGLDVRIPALQLLLGNAVEKVPDLAKKASPVFLIDSTDPPIFIVHGDQDPQVPVNQSLELWNVYKQKKLPVQLEIIPGGAHGSPAYDKKELMGEMKKFLDKELGE